MWAVCIAIPASGPLELTECDRSPAQCGKERAGRRCRRIPSCLSFCSFYWRFHAVTNPTPGARQAMAGRIVPRCRTNPNVRGRLGPQQKANRSAPYARDGAQKGRSPTAHLLLETDRLSRRFTPTHLLPLWSRNQGPVGSQNRAPLFLH